MIERLARLWLAAAAILLLLLTGSRLLAGTAKAVTDFFFWRQDLPVLVSVSLPAALLSLSPALRSGGARLISLCPECKTSAPLRAALVLAVLSAVIAFGGVYLVFDNYPLSMDEFFANFDAVIWRHGQTMAPVAQEWRSLAPALETMFMAPIGGHAFWVSAYLPVNAALRALAGLVGAAAALNPCLAAISVIATFAIGRRVWPSRPDLALVAASLLATSSQFLVTAMTPYAMTAHLALNLVWLWLFLRGGRLGHAGAIFVAFLACGLHQLLFHPLFAAPFVLQLWLERRWKTATLYTFAYVVICLFWTLYWPLVLAMQGVPLPSAAELGAPWLIARVADLVAKFDLADIGVMAQNLMRLMTWQNPLTVALSLYGFVRALRAKGTMRSLTFGLALTTAVMFVLLPFQGHGWGYRYLHGLLGSACLIAAFAWGRLTDRLDSRGKAAAGAAFVAVASISLTVLLPIRAWQAHRFLRPYAAAEGAIGRARTQIVFVNADGMWFGDDLVRNDPYLRNRPLILNLGALDEDQMRWLCSRYTVSLFNRLDGHRFGIRTLGQTPAQDPETELRVACPSLRGAIKPP